VLVGACKEMENNSLPIPPKPPKASNMRLFWIVVSALLAGVALLLFVLWVFGTSLEGSDTTTPRTTFVRFKQEMLKQQDVAKVVAYKSGDLVIAEVYIKLSSLSKYHDAKKQSNPFGLSSEDAGPQYIFTAATFDSLVKAMNDAQKSIPDDEKVQVSFEQGHDSLALNWFVQCVIMALMLVGVLWFIKFIRTKAA
jgi:cell division protease FtsH